MTSVLVVDDSGFVRTVVGTALAERGYDVTTASDGHEAIERVREGDPDVVTMDVEMPGVDGIEATERIMATDPRPVVVVSAHTREGAAATLKALARGALDVVPKPAGDDAEPAELGERVADTVEAVAGADVSALAAGPAPTRDRGSAGTDPAVDSRDPDADRDEGGSGSDDPGVDGDDAGPGAWTDPDLPPRADPDPVLEGDGAATGGDAGGDPTADPGDDGAVPGESVGSGSRSDRGTGQRARTDGATTADLGEGWPAAGRTADGVETPEFDLPPGDAPTVVVASSTGGPEVVETVMAGLPRSLDARVLVVQHMPETFTSRLAAHLDGVSEYDVAEATDGAWVGGGEALVAPGDRHVRVDGAAGGRLRVALDRGEPVHSVRPAADVTMQTAAEHAPEPLVGVVLTGMGRDGAAGVEAIAGAGGLTVAQDRDTSPVFGMPEQAIATGAVEAVCPAAEIPRTICDRLSGDGDDRGGDAPSGDREDDALSGDREDDAPSGDREDDALPDAPTGTRGSGDRAGREHRRERKREGDQHP